MSLGNFGKIALCWSVVTAAGISLFVVSRKSVDNRRYRDMQVRERMKKANIGEYESSNSRRFTA